MKKLVNEIVVGDYIELAEFIKHRDFEPMQPSIEPFSRSYARGIFDKVNEIKVEDSGIEMILEKTGYHFVSFFDGPLQNFLFCREW